MLALFIFPGWQSEQRPQCFYDSLSRRSNQVRLGQITPQLHVAVIPLETRILLVLDFIAFLACNPIKVLF